MKNKYKILITIISLLILTEVIVNYIPSKDRSTSIIETLEKNCNCKEIKQSIYMKGIQFSKNDISREKGVFQLIDCNYKNIDKEANHILNLLQKKVKNFNEIDQLELEFISNGITQSIIIKNGIIQK